MSTPVDARLHAVADALRDEQSSSDAARDAWDVVVEAVRLLDRDVMQRTPAEDGDARTARRFIDILDAAGYLVTWDALDTLALALVRVRDHNATDEQTRLVRSVFSSVAVATAASI